MRQLLPALPWEGVPSDITLKTSHSHGIYHGLEVAVALRSTVKMGYRYLLIIEWDKLSHKGAARRPCRICRVQGCT